MWLLEVPLSMSSAPITELTINAANDLGLILLAAYALQLHQSEPKDTLKKTLATTGKRVFIDCGLNCIAFLPLWVLSWFIPVQQVGWIMLLMLVSCAGASVCIMPKLLLLVTKQKKKEEMYEEAATSNVGNLVSTSNAE